MIGTTKIIVPVDVEVSLSVNCLYGDLTFSISPSRALRNEHYHQETRDYLKSNKECQDFLDHYDWRCGGGQRDEKQAYVIIALTSILFVLFFSHSLLEILDFDWSIFLHDVEKTEKFVFVIGLQHVPDLSLSPVLGGIEELSLRKMQANLKRILAGQEVVQVADPDLDASFKSLSGKLNL